MKIYRGGGWAVLFAAWVAGIQAAQFPLYSTGVDHQGQLLTEGADPHYSIVRVGQAFSDSDGFPVIEPLDPFYVLALPRAPVVAVNPPLWAWVPNGPTSNWIGPSAGIDYGCGDSAGIDDGGFYVDRGVWTYQTNFDLTGLDPETVVITGQWGTDDPGWMYLNLDDASVPDPDHLVISGGGFSLLPSFEISGDNGLFRPGLNTLTFLVWDAGNCVTGLRMDIQSAAADPLQCVLPPPDMISWWTGDGDAEDSIDGNHGALVNGAGFAPGKVGLAFSLDGFNSYVDVGNASNLHVSSGDFTIDAWVLFNDLTHEAGTTNAPAGDMSIVDKMLAGSDVNVDGWRLLKQDDNRFWFCLGGGDSNRCADPEFTVFSATVAEVGKWYHVAAVKDASGISLYVNGVLEDARSPLPQFLDTHSANLLIGANAAEIAGLDGIVDEVEIFNRALSAQEIEGIYAAGGTGKCLYATIDIKPGDGQNSINPRSRGVIPVALLTTAQIDATMVDPATVHFGPNAAALSTSATKDVDRDGDLDWIFHFRTQDIGISCNTTSAMLTGETFSGRGISGTDLVRPVGCR